MGKGGKDCARILHMSYYQLIGRTDWLLDRELLGLRKFLATVANQKTCDKACRKDIWNITI